MERGNKHHILHDRQEWSLRPAAKKLRGHESLIPDIWQEVHTELHNACPPVPLLGYHALNRTVKLWYPHKQPVDSMMSLMDAIHDASEHPAAHPIERDLAHLAINAIQLQIPFIKEGIRPLRVVR